MANLPQKYIQLIDARAAEIKALLPKYFDPEIYLYNAKKVQDNRLLDNCAPERLLECVFDAARRGLEIGGPNKHCAIVPFKTKSGGEFPVLVVQWQGKAFLWNKSGAIKKLRADVVYTWDGFSYDAGAETIHHVPDFDSKHSPKQLNDIANIKAAYAVATLWSGERAIAVVGHDALVRVMEWVAAKNNGKLGFGWTDWVPEMCRKTAVHRLEGFIQPPPDLSPEQIAAWNRVTAPEPFDIETTASELPDNNPEPSEPTGAARVETITLKGGTPRDKTTESPLAAGAGGVVVPPNQNADASGPEPTLTQDQQDDLIQFARDNNKSLMVLARFIKASTGCDDLSQIKRSQLQGLQEKMAAEWGA